MTPSNLNDLPGPGIFGAGIALRMSLAAIVIVLLWLAAFWAATPRVQPAMDHPAAAMQGGTSGGA